MTTHQQTALDFCREVLGWSEVFGPHPSNNKALCGGSFTEYRAFDPTDLTSVTNAVRQWCDRTGCRIETALLA